MVCYLCKFDTEYKSSLYVEVVCLSCEKTLRESDIRYRNFMQEYKIQHAACPKCGGLDYTTTLAGYTFNSDNPEQYKDLNTCECSMCHNRHTAHDRVPKIETNEENNYNNN